MPVTTFALLILGVIGAAALTVWAMSAWGFLNIVPILLCLVLVARWALAHVPQNLNG